ETAQAAEYLLEQLRKRPTMRGFKTLMGLYIDQLSDKTTADSLRLLKELVEKQMLQRPKYRCSSCGFSGRKLYWLCPSCKKWGVNMHDPRVIVALDYDNKDTALAFVDKLDSSLCKLKVGKEMFTLFGPEFVKALIAKGFDVFLDLKFHDIPNTVAKACKAAAELGVWMVNVHASGGLPMMQAAKEAIATSSNPQTKLI
ncbi:unnamed protein product, partial [Chrysoparadoxa australica]